MVYSKDIMAIKIIFIKQAKQSNRLRGNVPKTVPTIFFKIFCRRRARFALPGIAGFLRGWIFNTDWTTIRRSLRPHSSDFWRPNVLQLRLPCRISKGERLSY